MGQWNVNIKVVATGYGVNINCIKTYNTKCFYDRVVYLQWIQYLYERFCGKLAL